MNLQEKTEISYLEKNNSLLKSEKYLTKLTSLNQKILLKHLSWCKTARTKQITPKGDWNVWLILAGRGWGKTRTGAQDIAFYGLTKPNSRIAIVTPTFGDGRDTCIEGVSGLLGCIEHDLIENWNRSIGELTLKNGTIYKTFSSEQPDRLRGPQFHRAWCDELGSWKNPEAWDQLLFGLRLGDKPQVIITTTPKPTQLIKELVNNKDSLVTRGSTFENKDNLADSAVKKLEEKYKGTRLGRQELYAEILEDVEGALWNRNMISKALLKNTDKTPNFTRTVIAIDPAVTQNKLSNETGIVVCARGEDNKFYIIDDISGKYTPDAWARKAVDNYYKYEADKIIAEVNNGGDLVERVIRNIDGNVSYGSVRATKGKYLRAEPISALYEQDRVKHLKPFQFLEDQMANYNPMTFSGSPDRLDALVWGLTELSMRTGQVNWRIT
jgi:predicted phage terminase large subunit-like protein